MQTTLSKQARQLPRAEEAESILAEQGLIDVDCNFCGQHYRFDAVETTQIFTPSVQQPPASRTAH